MKPYALLLAAALSGLCFLHRRYGAIGKMNHSFRCGTALIDACNKNAAELCPRGCVMGIRQTRMVRPNLMMIECKA